MKLYLVQHAKAAPEPANMVALKQGGIVALSRSEENQWQIDWMVTPELLI